MSHPQHLSSLPQTETAAAAHSLCGPFGEGRVELKIVHTLKFCHSIWPMFVVLCSQVGPRNGVVVGWCRGDTEQISEHGVGF